jgi:hypothetical protein
MNLHRVLLSVIASAGAGSAACETTSTPPKFKVEKSFELPVDGATACGLMQATYDTCSGGTRDACARACRDQSVTHCVLPTDYEDRWYGWIADAGPGAPACPELGESRVLLSCRVITPEDTERRRFFRLRGCPIPGRRPDGLIVSIADTREGSDPKDEEKVLGAYFARCAHFEAASVVAFQQLAVELRALGAPDDLLTAVACAEADEARHAAITGTFAARFGGGVPRVEIERQGCRSLEALAIDNVIEGVVGETFGAAIALWQAQHATDPDIRRAMATIAADECEHAALSLRIDAWARSRLPEGFLDEFREHALAALVESAAAERSAQRSAERSNGDARAGLPDARARVAIARGVVCTLAA